jgi:hypothetical protein
MASRCKSSIKTMVEIHKEMQNSERRAQELGLQLDELAFYEAVATNYEKIYDTKSC